MQNETCRQHPQTPNPQTNDEGAAPGQGPRAGSDFHQHLPTVGQRIPLQQAALLSPPSPDEPLKHRTSRGEEIGCLRGSGKGVMPPAPLNCTVSDTHQGASLCLCSRANSAPEEPHVRCLSSTITFRDNQKLQEKLQTTLA